MKFGAIMWDRRMRIKKDQYDLMAKSINSFIFKKGIDKIREHRKTVNYADDQFTSFVWSMYWMAVPQIVKNGNEGLLDKHIETALKSIMEAYKNGR